MQVKKNRMELEEEMEVLHQKRWRKVGGQVDGWGSSWKDGLVCDPKQVEGSVL